MIINLCSEQDVAFVFALGRRSLGRACAKLVPVSVVGVFNYQGAEVSLLPIAYRLTYRRDNSIIVRVLELSLLQLPDLCSSHMLLLVLRITVTTLSLLVL